MKISVRLEGGLGDCLLGNRFVSAIKEKYPESSITAYIDSEGKTFQKQSLSYLYPHVYSDIKVIPSKKYKELWVDSQFGQEKHYGALENVPEEIRIEMESYDRFYDLHIDSMKWVSYDFDWYRYFKFFPKAAQNKPPPEEEYILCHLVSSSSKEHLMSKGYIEDLITELKTTDKKIYIISTPETNDYYSEFQNDKQITIVNDSIENICDLISGAKVFVATDSGFRYIAYGYSVPTVTFSKQCFAPFEVLKSHYARWLMYPELTFPLSFDYKYISIIAKKILWNKGYSLAPTVNNFDAEMVNRKYSINLEKSILNE